ncbi:hypothetical protein OCU04_001081 [Sclerotinia nivalis]|uniref:Uncharacterized protein n=1 Tax=Sclerotinia nivalis TaxID=352851 RepID=A0A9X0DQD7_9HELO|nr:hypothetical protein OCU04_001081 [Sclerotinia nivalis]
MISQILFAICMISTLFLTSLFGGLMIMAIMGISWGVTAWAPFAIISTEIVKQASEDQPDMELRPGIVLGLHNVAISVPKILAGIEGSIVYWAFQNGSYEVDDDGTAWVLALAGVSALYSAYLIVCLRKGENQL